MKIPKKRLVAVQNGSGRIKTVQQEVPELGKGSVLVQVGASLVSPGTEVGGWHLFAQQKNHHKPRKETPFGYSNSGVVVEVAEDVAEFKPGDRVACIGAGYALHTDFAVVPHNLCTPLPDDVPFEQGSFAMLLATAMQALRRGQPDFGENVCVVGLGIVGLLTARLYQLAGNYVLGWEKLLSRVSYANNWGVPAIIEDENGLQTTRTFTHGEGMDSAVLANAGPCDDTLDRLVQCMKVAPDGHAMGRIMVVGWPEFHYGQGLIGKMNNIDLRRCSRTGPGYHDVDFEFGLDYPHVFMRWTTRSNLTLCMRLLSEGRIDVNALITHRIKLLEVEREIESALQNPDAMLGVIIHP